MKSANDSFAPAFGDALVVVDVQRDFLPGGALEVPHGDAVIQVLNRYIGAFDRRHLPVVITRDWHPVNHSSFRELGGPWPPHCVAGTPGAELPPSLRRPAHLHVISKGTRPEAQGYSAFEGTELAQLLRDEGCHRVFIGGLATDFCVRSTARDALRAGFDVVVLEDAVRAVNLRPDDGAHALADVVRHGGHLMHLEAAAA
jgi:nicotinamidase/pyrazinamidase